jgi:hypothetical protein
MKEEAGMGGELHAAVSFGDEDDGRTGGRPDGDEHT